jgi:hypothetical protein
LRPTVAALVVFAVAFGFVEAGIVTALRLWLDPGGAHFPLVELPASYVAVERGREAATLVVLAAAAVVAVRGGAARFAAFLLVFGVWDLAYYAALRLFMGWPRTLAEWDLLFLLPVRWLGPVWAPVTVSLVMIACAAVALRFVARHGDFAVRPQHASAAVVGGALALASFVWPAPEAALPARYRVEWLVAGLAIGVGGFVAAVRFNQRLAASSSNAGAPTNIARARAESRPRVGA